MTNPATTPGPARQVGLRRRLVVLFVIAGAALLLVVAVLFSSLLQLQHRREATVDRYDPASLAAGDLQAAMLDQETGVRGYYLSGDSEYLEPYTSGQATSDEAFATLERLLRGDEDALTELAATRTAIDEWRTGYAARVVSGTTPGGGGPGRASSAFLDQSRTAFDQVRQALDRLDAAIAVQRDDAVEAWQNAFRTVVAVGIVSVIGLLVVGVIIFIGLRRSVTDPIEQLAGEVRVVARGDYQNPVVGRGPPEIVALGADIDAMRARILDELDRLEAARAEISQQAVELGRSNADLEQFAYVASHDLQEPLRKIAGFCQLLERRYKGQLDDKADQYIEFVVDGAKRMQDLINDLLAFSRVGRTTERFVPVKLNAAADTALANLGSVPEEQGARIDIGPLPTIDGDPRLLAAVFQNLIGNAVKFRGDDDPVVEIRAVSDDETCRILVSDNGIGIDPEYGEQIFTLFQRLHNKSQYEGTGIGLALSKKILEFHGGTIRLVPDAPAAGATFELVLPLRSALPSSGDVTVEAAASTAADAAPPSSASDPDPASPDATTPDDEVLQP